MPFSIRHQQHTSSTPPKLALTNLKNRTFPQVRLNGGLFVIGTYLFESNRVELQLFGRAGRQVRCIVRKHVWYDNSSEGGLE